MSSANGYLSVSTALITITDRQNNAAIRNLSSIDNLPKSQMRIICGKMFIVGVAKNTHVVFEF